MPEIGKRSKWQCLFHYFEGAVWEQEAGSFRTETLAGTTVTRPEIARPLAGELSRLQDFIDQHWVLHAQRRGLGGPVPPAPQIATPEPNVDEIENQIAELLGEEVAQPINGTTATEAGVHGSVHPSQILLVEVSASSRVDGVVFPRSFNCARCGHYEIVSPNGTDELECHCCLGWCKTCEKEADSPDSASCDQCGGSFTHPPLRQYNIVFACPRCAQIEELTPRTRNLSQLAGGPIPCDRCSAGHLHFLLGQSQSLNVARWRCYNSACNYWEHLDKFCRCHIPADEQNHLPGRPSIMRPIPTSASLCTPLSRSYLWLGSNSVTLATLKEQHEQTSSDDPYSWRLVNHVEPVEREMISQLYGIEDAFSIPQVRTTTVLFGYRSGISSYPVNIQDNERLARLFTEGRHQRRYRAFLADTVGRALVVELSRNKVIEALRNETAIAENRAYQDVAADSVDYLSSGPFQEVISGVGPVALPELIHAYEHALFRTSTSLVGLEIFGSKILLGDGAIVLYEREEVGPGGLVQLGSLQQFLRWLQETRRVLWNCPQMCRKACPACLFVNDYFCQAWMPNEVPRWLPPNALIDRKRAHHMVQRVSPTNTR